MPFIFSSLIISEGLYSKTFRRASYLLFILVSLTIQAL